MSDYYNSNGIYQYLSDNSLDRFEFVSGNCWQLVYGNKDADPLLLVLVYGYEDLFNSSSVPTSIENGYKTLEKLSYSSELPIIFVAFNQSEDDIEKVIISTDFNNFSTITLEDLTGIYKSYNLPVRNAKTKKYLNDKTSSAYHKWQRDQLGSDLVVSDIDLCAIKNTQLSAIFELKRSFISLEKWSPYPDDYRNFILISKLCHKAGIKFFIIYNVRKKNPTKDIVDKIKIFRLVYKNGLKIGKGEIHPINELFK